MEDGSPTATDAPAELFLTPAVSRALGLGSCPAARTTSAKIPNNNQSAGVSFITGVPVPAVVCSMTTPTVRNLVVQEENIVSMPQCKETRHNVHFQYLNAVSHFFTIHHIPFGTFASTDRQSPCKSLATTVQHFTLLN
jgi:hypothetical protein